MHFTDEELIAYLLGDAVPSTVRRIESQLDRDPALVERLGYFRKLLGHLDSAAPTNAQPPFEPPAGLVESTMSRVFDTSPPTNWQLKKRGVKSAVLLSTALESPRSPRSIWDSTALTICLTVLCCLALPAIVRARFEARRSQCAEKLRVMGNGFFGYALNDPEQRLPSLALHGPSAFAGANTMHLYEAGFLNSLEQLFCPSLSSHFQASDMDELQEKHPELAASLFFKIPSEVDLFELSESQLATVQGMLGGDYALPLGIVENGRPVAPRHEGRSAYPIASDAPVFIGANESFIAHDGCGINILYDDGHVSFFSVVALDVLADDPFCNALGDRRIGLHREDASVAPSQFVPLGATADR